MPDPGVTLDLTQAKAYQTKEVMNKVLNAGGDALKVDIDNATITAGDLEIDTDALETKVDATNTKLDAMIVDLAAMEVDLAALEVLITAIKGVTDAMNFQGANLKVATTDQI
tara:strand:- start:716 stop:1051 length:336 start_codon:yes stop_codon:yes gene_type:complete